MSTYKTASIVIPHDGKYLYYRSDDKSLGDFKYRTIFPLTSDEQLKFCVNFAKQLDEHIHVSIEVLDDNGAYSVGKIVSIEEAEAASNVDDLFNDR